MIFKLVDRLKYPTAVSHRAAGSVAIRVREPGPTRAKGRFRQLEEVHCLEMVTFLVDAAVVQSWDFGQESGGLLLIRPFVALSST